MVLVKNKTRPKVSWGGGINLCAGSDWHSPSPQSHSLCLSLSLSPSLSRSTYIDVNVQYVYREHVHSTDVGEKEEGNQNGREQESCILRVLSLTNVFLYISYIAYVYTHCG